MAHAFSSTFLAIQAGGGPTSHFPAYLLTSVRNAVREQARRRSTRVVTTGDVALDASVGSNDGPLERGDHPLAVAYGELPDRWQRVLWATEVEGYAPRELARELGLTPNAVAALSLRARTGLREAYLHAIAGDDPHGWAAERLEAYQRGVLSYDERLLVGLHADGCSQCALQTGQRSAASGSTALLLLLAGARPAAGPPGSALAAALASLREAFSSPAGLAVTGSAGIATTALGGLALIVPTPDPSPGLARPRPPSAAAAAPSDGSWRVGTRLDPDPAAAVVDVGPRLASVPEAAVMEAGESLPTDDPPPSTLPEDPSSDEVAPAEEPSEVANRESRPEGTATVPSVGDSAAAPSIADPLPSNDVVAAAAGEAHIDLDIDIDLDRDVDRDVDHGVPPAPVVTITIDAAGPSPLVDDRWMLPGVLVAASARPAELPEVASRAAQAVGLPDELPVGISVHSGHTARPVPVPDPGLAPAPDVVPDADRAIDVVPALDLDVALDLDLGLGSGLGLSLG